MSERAGTPARPEDLVNVDELIAAYYDIKPDPTVPEQRVVFGTSGHRGSSLDGAFNEAHIAAVSLAVAEYRAEQGVTGPLFLGADTHPLSQPAERTARAVLTAAGVDVQVPATNDDEYVPTPSLSHAILVHNRDREENLADGVIITPSHNPPRDGGIKYNPTHGGPADVDATGWIAKRANELLESRAEIPQDGGPSVSHFDFLGDYVEDLADVINFEAVRESDLRIAAHPLGGASQNYWSAIRDRYDIDLTVVGPGIDPQWAFMTLDWDGKIRMDPSSAHAMAGVLEYRDQFDLVTGNDADADRHGIVTRDGGLMNPNHFLAVAIDYLLTHRPDWPTDAKIGKTIVSSRMIDRVVASHGRELFEVPVGFKWFVSGLLDGGTVFGGEESAGASFVRFDGTAWSTDKDGILLALLAAEMWAVTGKSPSERYVELTEQFGEPAYARTDSPATTEQKAKLAKLSPDDVAATELAGEPIVEVLTHAPGNGAAIGGLVLRSESAWCAIRPSGTEAVMKVYAESFRGEDHLALVQQAAVEILGSALGE
ncbi:MAG: phosphoglucomutase (alpha-D-glucose-1,6-bisphosphate-dependent) [Canibacter sp.]